MNFLNNLKLTLSQYIMGTLAAAIGVLVILLKIKSEQLHSTRVQLLKSVNQVEQDKADAKVTSAMDQVEQAKAKLNGALAAYRAAHPNSELPGGPKSVDF